MGDRWIPSSRRLLGTLVAAGSLGVSVASTAQPSTPTQAVTGLPVQPIAPQAGTPDDELPIVGPPRPGAEIDPDLQFLRSILQNAANTSEVRQGAAQRIVARGSSDARRIIDEALRSGDPGQIDAVATAVDEDSRRPGAMLESLLAALSVAPRELHPKLTRLLAREGDAAAERVASMALDGARSPAERLGAIYAMGQLRGRDQVPELVSLLDERRREPPEVVRETCDALDRTTGLRLGNSPEAWRQWWAARRATPNAEVLVASLKEQIAQLQKQMDLELERSSKLSARLRQSYLDFLMTMPAPERSERIGMLLDDELAEVRSIGLSQMERMLRNGERPSDALAARVLERLTDRVPAIRLRAMRVLDNMAAPRLADRVAELLPAESDAATAEAMLRLLADRPGASGYGPAAARLGEPALAEAAAAAINRIADGGLARAGWEAEVIEPARRAMAQKATPEIIRLVAAAGNDADRDAVTEYLVSTDEALRLGAAEGLRRAGRRRALVERVQADPSLYPIAVAAIADQPATSAVVQALIELPPRPEQVDAWNLAMGRVLAGLPSKDLIAADERIATLAIPSSKARIAGLRAATDSPQNGGDPALRIDLLARLADLLLAADDARSVLRLLGDEPLRSNPTLRPRVFHAAAIEGDYEMAATIEPRPEPWIVLLESLVGRAPRVARPLADEITQRFGRVLSSTEQERLAVAERSLAASSEG